MTNLLMRTTGPPGRARRVSPPARASGRRVGPLTRVCGCRASLPARASRLRRGSWGLKAPPYGAGFAASPAFAGGLAGESTSDPWGCEGVLEVAGGLKGPPRVRGDGRKGG